MNFGVEALEGVVFGSENRGDLARTVPVREIGIVYCMSRMVASLLK
jgi:hypothetical protein